VILFPRQALNQFGDQFSADGAGVIGVAIRNFEESAGAEDDVFVEIGDDALFRPANREAVDGDFLHREAGAGLLRALSLIAEPVPRHVDHPAIAGLRGFVQQVDGAVQHFTDGGGVVAPCALHADDLRAQGLHIVMPSNGRPWDRDVLSRPPAPLYQRYERLGVHQRLADQRVAQGIGEALHLERVFVAIHAARHIHRQHERHGAGAGRAGDGEQEGEGENSGAHGQQLRTRRAGVKGR